LDRLCGLREFPAIELEVTNDRSRNSEAILLFQSFPKTGNGHLLEAEGDVKGELFLRGALRRVGSLVRRESDIM